MYLFVSIQLSILYNSLILSVFITQTISFIGYKNYDFEECVDNKKQSLIFSEINSSFFIEFSNKENIKQFIECYISVEFEPKNKEMGFLVKSVNKEDNRNKSKSYQQNSHCVKVRKEKQNLLLCNNNKISIKGKSLQLINSNIVYKNLLVIAYKVPNNNSCNDSNFSIKCYENYKSYCISNDIQCEAWNKCTNNGCNNTAIFERNTSSSAENRFKNSSKELSFSKNESKFVSKSLFISKYKTFSKEMNYTKDIIQFSDNYENYSEIERLANMSTTQRPTTLDPETNISSTDRTIILLSVVITPIVFSIFLSIYLERRRAKIRAKRIYERLQFDSQNIT